MPDRHPYAVRVLLQLRARGVATPLPREYGLRLISEALRIADELRDQHPEPSRGEAMSDTKLNTRITIELLEAHGACSMQRTLFAARFPEGVEVTEELVLQHHREFDLAWAADELLTYDAYDEYEVAKHAAWAKFDEAMEPAWAEFDKVMEPARDQYRANAITTEVFDAIEDEAEEKLDAVREPARAERSRACAVAFAKAVLAHGLKGVTE